MKIEISDVNAVADGAQVLLTVTISDGEHREKRKLLIFTEQYLSLGLSWGAVIDEETLDTLISASKLCRAMKKGCDLLSYSPSSRTRLKSRLISKGIDRESAEEAAERLAQIGAIDEQKDASRAVRSCLKKLWGRKRIINELYSKGYPQDVITDALSELEDDVWLNGCVAFLRKKGASNALGDPQEIKKLIACASRYGYSYSEIKQALEILCED